jgi:hypothetical protein
MKVEDLSQKELKSNKQNWWIDPGIAAKKEGEKTGQNHMLQPPWNI